MPSRSHPLVARPTGPATAGRDGGGECRRACCWTPYGHSTARDAYPPHAAEACKCHPKETP